MNRDDFWQIVESVGWDGLCLRARDAVQPHGERSHELGKKLLLLKLPTIEACEGYSSHMYVVEMKLSKAIQAWEAETAERFPCSDDSFGDLCAHIIGLGRKEFNRNVKNPSLAFERATNYDYTESFSYCTPHKSDYEPTCLQLAREVSGLIYWQECLATSEAIQEQSLQSTTARHEVERRGEACKRLRKRLEAEGGVALTQEAYKAHLTRMEVKRDAAQQAVSKRRVAKKKAKEKLLKDFESEWDAKSLDEWF